MYIYLTLYSVLECNLPTCPGERNGIQDNAMLWKGMDSGACVTRPQPARCSKLVPGV